MKSDGINLKYDYKLITDVIFCANKLEPGTWRVEIV